MPSQPLLLCCNSSVHPLSLSLAAKAVRMLKRLVSEFSGVDTSNDSSLLPFSCFDEPTPYLYIQRIDILQLSGHVVLMLATTKNRAWHSHCCTWFGHRKALFKESLNNAQIRQKIAQIYACILSSWFEWSTIGTLVLLFSVTINWSALT